MDSILVKCKRKVIMSIKVLAICGAANKRRNTATMLNSAFDAALSIPGANVEIVYLYDLNFK